MTNKDKILNDIYENFINDNNKDAVFLINKNFILYDFGELYLNFLKKKFLENPYEIFAYHVIIFNRLTNR